MVLIKKGKCRWGYDCHIDDDNRIMWTVRFLWLTVHITNPKLSEHMTNVIVYSIQQPKWMVENCRIVAETQKQLINRFHDRYENQISSLRDNITIAHTETSRIRKRNRILESTIKTMMEIQDDG